MGGVMSRWRSWSSFEEALVMCYSSWRFEYHHNGITFLAWVLANVLTLSPFPVSLQCDELELRASACRDCEFALALPFQGFERK